MKYRISIKLKINRNAWLIYYGRFKEIFYHTHFESIKIMHTEGHTLNDGVSNLIGNNGKVKCQINRQQ